MRILLVDDDPEIRLLAGFLLRAAGHDVAEAPDGAAARASAGQAAPDVILMDVLLGAEDGIALAAELTSGGGPRVVFLTAASRPEQDRRMLELAPAGIVRKPFQPETFVSTLTQLLEAGR